MIKKVYCFITTHNLLKGTSDSVVFMDNDVLRHHKDYIFVGEGSVEIPELTDAFVEQERLKILTNKRNELEQKFYEQVEEIDASILEMQELNLVT